MSAGVIICLTILGVVLLTDVSLSLCLRLNFKSFQSKAGFEPMVSILVAARNEEENVAACIESLLRLEYPSDKLEILVGDDMSLDDTAEIVKGFAVESNLVRLYSMDSNVQYSKGKANVLAHLAKHATGDFFFITDADCQVNPGWIKGLLSAYDEQVGIGVGVTDVNSIWQSMDWLFALGMIKSLHDLNTPVVAMGNNMFVTRKAYESVGGYESIPFSITEDLELFKQVKKQGFETKHVVSPDSLVVTRGTKGLINLLRQRKRWLKGALQLNPAIVILLLMQALYYPAILILVFLQLPTAFLIFSVKSVLQASIVAIMATKIKKPKPIFRLVLFEFYQTYVAIISSLFYLLPQPVIWKGRKY